MGACRCIALSERHCGVPCAVGLVFLALVVAMILAHCLLPPVVARLRARRADPSGPLGQACALAAPRACRLQRPTPVLVLQPGPGNEVMNLPCVLMPAIGLGDLTTILPSCDAIQVPGGGWDA